MGSDQSNNYVLVKILTNKATIMKNVKLFILAILAAAVFSCSDDANPVNDNNDTAINLLEETALDSSTVLDNLKINGATKKAGAPTPNGAISFQLDKPTSSAFLKTGFNIKIKETSDAFVGVYLQIKSVEGTVADGYWDITDISSKSSPVKTKTKSSNRALLSKVGRTGGSITVNFLDGIAPGKFCYAICVYDGSGNISQPTEVCIEVENWGGFSDLIGDWGFVSEENIENGVSDGIVNVGEEDCEESSFYCTNISPQKEVVYQYCDKIIALDLGFNAAGTYLVNETYDYSDIDYEASQVNCVAVGVNETYEYLSEGKWAYDEEESILTLIEFYYEEDGDSETIPDGEVLFQGPVFLSNGILTITDAYIEDNYTAEWILKFSKK
jgi:hypothetical protein